MRKLNAWNLKQGDGKQFGASFNLDIDEVAIIRGHRMQPGDVIYVLDVAIVGDSPECGVVYAGLATMDCKPLAMAFPSSRGDIAGPGIFKVSRTFLNGDIQGQHMEVSVEVHQIKPGVGQLSSRGFACNCGGGGCNKCG